MKRWEIRGLTSKRVRVFDPAEVTAQRATEVDPGLVGLTRDDVESIWGAVVDFYKTGFHPALALCVRRRGEVILDRTIGHARGNSPEEPEGTPSSCPRHPTRSSTSSPVRRLSPRCSCTCWRSADRFTSTNPSPPSSPSSRGTESTGSRSVICSRTEPGFQTRRPR